LADVIQLGEGVTARGIEYLSSLSHLSRLAVQGNIDTRDEVVRALASSIFHSERLVGLDLLGAHIVSRDALRSVVGCCPNVEVVRLSGELAGDASVKTLLHLKGLRELDLVNSDFLTDEGAALLKWPKLEALW